MSGFRVTGADFYVSYICAGPWSLFVGIEESSRPGGGRVWHLEAGQCCWTLVIGYSGEAENCAGGTVCIAAGAVCIAGGAVCIASGAGGAGGAVCIAGGAGGAVCIAGGAGGAVCITGGAVCPFAGAVCAAVCTV